MIVQDRGRGGGEDAPDNSIESNHSKIREFLIPCRISLNTRTYTHIRFEFDILRSV